MKPILFASLFLTDIEARFSANALELLAVAWTIEYFEKSVCATNFSVERVDKRCRLF